MLTPDEWGCYDCVWRNGFTCDMSGYNIAEQDGPPCARFKKKERKGNDTYRQGQGGLIWN